MNNRLTFSTPMVQAILAGQKTQTREIVKSSDGMNYTISTNNRFSGFVTDPLLDENTRGKGVYASFNNGQLVVKRKYQLGDVLYVQERWTLMEPKNNEGPQFYLYKADEPDCESSPWFSKWQSPIYMPRAAARIFLRVVDVRVERLQEISDVDVIAEGFKDEMCSDYLLKKNSCTNCPSGDCVQYHGRFKFKNAWNSLNAKRGFPWYINPWVWVISFERTEGNERYASRS